MFSWFSKKLLANGFSKNMEERLVCKSCLIKELRSSKDFILMEEARIVINNYTKKIERVLNPYLNEIQRKFQSIEQYIDEQKMTWINKNEKDFLNIFDNIKINDEDWLKDCELKITYEIQQLGCTYYHKIDKQLKQYADQQMNFKLADKVIEIAKLSQEKCWNVYIDNSIIKKNNQKQLYIYQIKQKFKLIFFLNIIRLQKLLISKRMFQKVKEFHVKSVNKVDQIQNNSLNFGSKQYQKLEQQQNAQLYMQEFYKNSLSKLEQLRNAQYKNLTNMIDSVNKKIVDGSNCFQQIYLQSDDFSIVKFQNVFLRIAIM